MSISKNNLYILLFTLFFASSIWILVNYQTSLGFNIEVCIFKKITSLPCPACGTTSAITLIIDGYFLEALQINPLGYFAIFLLITVPFWILYDLTFNKKSFYNFYEKVENHLKKPLIYFPLLVMVLGIWIWNITKTL